MKASYRWLRELIGSSLTASPHEVADRLTGAGLEVEALVPFGTASVQVMVARVVAKEPHPTRAKLSLVTVEAGDRTQRVVCGAPNVPEPGGLVVLAPLGTHLPAAGLTLDSREIAGVVSEGMLCSEAELGLRISGGSGGILVLADSQAEPGQRLADAIGESSDVVLEIGLTPNRPDGLGHLGLAREIAALYGIPFAPETPRPAALDAAFEVASEVSIRIEDEARCPRYGAQIVSGVRVAPSPLGVQYRLEALGIRAINNVVDITNLVMLKYGHPIHGFDLRRVRGKSIVVRCAAPGEKMTTLDEVVRALDADDLLIADGQGPVALAGVMGGAGSEIQPDTETVLIECAYFTPRGVRRTARRHGMHTESSHRFERGVDHGDTAVVLSETASLLSTLASGSRVSAQWLVGPGLPTPAPITLRQSELDGLLGVHTPMAEAKAILTRLGCSVSETDGSTLEVRAPSHRPDLSIEVDLIEEVMRVAGIDRVPTRVPAVRAELPRPEHIETRVVQAAVEVGLSQALLMSFSSKKDLASVHAPVPSYLLQNPLGEERGAMRTSLLPGLLEAERRARRHGASDVRLFASGAVFLPSDGRLAREARRFAAIVSGKRDSVLQKPEPVDVYDAKGLAQGIILRALGREAEVVAQAAEKRSAFWHPRAAGVVRVLGREVGELGVIHPAVVAELDLEPGAIVLELDLDVLDAIGVRAPKFSPIPTLPASTRDLAIVVSDDVLAGQVEKAIIESAGDILESATLFDLFRGGSVPKEHRSLAFHLVYRDPLAASDPARARTLTDAEVDQRHQLVLKTVEERFGAALRS